MRITAILLLSFLSIVSTASLTRAQDIPEYLKAPPVKTSLDPALLSELRKGGYLILFRHAETVMQPSFSGTPEFREDDFTHCGTQRNLSKDGRNQAAAIGEAFRALEIPIGFVRASPYCRTRDTAWLAFGRVTPRSKFITEKLHPRHGSGGSAKLAKNPQARQTAPNGGYEFHLCEPCQCGRSFWRILAGGRGSGDRRPGYWSWCQSHCKNKMGWLDRCELNSGPSFY